MSCNFVCFSNVLSQAYVLKNFTWIIIHMDFVGFPFKTTKFKNDINYIKCSCDFWLRTIIIKLFSSRTIILRSILLKE
jgi:hypothetical protein